MQSLSEHCQAFRNLVKSSPKQIGKWYFELYRTNIGAAYDLIYDELKIKQLDLIIDSLTDLESQDEQHKNLNKKIKEKIISQKHQRKEAQEKAEKNAALREERIEIEIKKYKAQLQLKHRYFLFKEGRMAKQQKRLNKQKERMALQSKKLSQQRIMAERQKETLNQQIKESTKQTTESTILYKQGNEKSVYSTSILQQSPSLQQSTIQSKSRNNQIGSKSFQGLYRYFTSFFSFTKKQRNNITLNDHSEQQTSLIKDHDQ